MRQARGARFHAVDVKARTFRKRIVELQIALIAQRLAIDHIGLEFRGLDIGDDAI